MEPTETAPTLTPTSAETAQPAPVETPRHTEVAPALSVQWKNELEDINKANDEADFSVKLERHLAKVEFGVFNLDDKIDHLNYVATMLVQRGAKLRVPESFDINLTSTGGNEMIKKRTEFAARQQSRMEQGRVLSERAKECRDSARRLWDMKATQPLVSQVRS
ncbi:MAG TPA: hypothetical protein VLH19_01880 [Patescibacteria group bacterium]|nr:hypothetical protein [Patescibacteria group bacterium]